MFKLTFKGEGEGFFSHAYLQFEYLRRCHKQDIFQLSRLDNLHLAEGRTHLCKTGSGEQHNRILTLALHNIMITLEVKTIILYYHTVLVSFALKSKDIRTTILIRQHKKA